APATMLPPLREEIGEALERLSRMLVQRVPDPLQTDAHDDDGAAGTEHIQESVRFLGQIASGWQYLSEDALPEDTAGFGSTVNVEDVESGSRETYTLMTGALLDIDAGQVSLASPIGQALLGCEPGMVVTVDTPQRRRTLRVLSVRTLRDRLDRLQLESAAV
ncbi:MAG: GreA/GreB family elongation factor, partial [Longimicrobiales bacterium]